MKLQAIAPLHAMMSLWKIIDCGMFDKNRKLITRIYNCLFFPLLVCLMLSCNNHSKDVSSYESELNCENGDLLCFFDFHMNQLSFDGYVSGANQVLFESLYHCNGHHAQEVEAYLTKKFGMNSLRFLCCGWEPSLGKTGNIFKSFKMKNSGAYVGGQIAMYSQETLINTKDDWHLIDTFFVRASIILF